MRDGSCLVFVEVRYRSSNRRYAATETVDIHKRRKLAKTAAHFLARRSISDEQTVRFDVVGIELDEQGSASIDWISDAFYVDEL